MRTFKRALLLLALFLVMAPAPAHAWWGWLEELSGPGPFNGLEFDFRLVCFMNQPSIQQATVAMATARALTETVVANRKLDSNALEIQKLLSDLSDLDATSRDDALVLSSKIIALRAQLKTVSDLAFPDPIREPQSRSSPSAAAAGSPGPGLALVGQRKRDWDAVQNAWDAVARLSREAAVPGVARPHGIGYWASCSDRLHGEPPKVGNVRILHQDRHPVVSLVLNYREFANTEFLQLKSKDARPSQAGYAGGKTIHMRILEPKISWPMSGHFDFLDGQAGIGIYQFSSAGFKEGSKSFSGLVFEPIRFDLHAPAKLVEGIQGKKNWWKRLPLCLSYSAGVMFFPGGFASTRFNADAGVARNISGGEGILEQGFVINVRRVLGL